MRKDRHTKTMQKITHHFSSESNKVIFFALIVFLLLALYMLLVLLFDRTSPVGKMGEKFGILPITPTFTPAPSVIPSNDNLTITNAQDGQTFYVVVGSNVGLILDADKTSSYVNLDNRSDVLVAHEKPFLDSVHQKLEVVYHAQKAGKARLQYYITTPCGIPGCSVKTSLFHVYVDVVN